MYTHTLHYIQIRGISLKPLQTPVNIRLFTFKIDITSVDEIDHLYIWSTGDVYTLNRYFF